MSICSAPAAKALSEVWTLTSSSPPGPRALTVRVSCPVGKDSTRSGSGSGSPVHELGLIACTLAYVGVDHRVDRSAGSRA